MNRPKFISTVIGMAAMVGLFLFYSLTMRFLAGSWDAAWWQFRQLWFLMTPLIAGFGVQIGLFSYIKFLSHSTANKIVAASSATSTVSMIACCAHHLTDVVPLLGLSAVSLWLTAYQRPLLIIGILSNLAGIIYMWKAKNQL
ncbi:hypothetical protein HYU89_04250 [Candidatus Collierbacteria bacterium]|nr:hypothetical protein [Candidatus Collierbacteria bacterium]